MPSVLRKALSVMPVIPPRPRKAVCGSYITGGGGFRLSVLAVSCLAQKSNLCAAQSSVVICFLQQDMMSPPKAKTTHLLIPSKVPNPLLGFHFFRPMFSCVCSQSNFFSINCLHDHPFFRVYCDVLLYQGKPFSWPKHHWFQKGTIGFCVHCGNL